MQDVVLSIWHLCFNYYQVLISSALSPRQKWQKLWQKYFLPCFSPSCGRNTFLPGRKPTLHIGPTCVQDDIIMIVCFFYSFRWHDRLILSHCGVGCSKQVYLKSRNIDTFEYKFTPRTLLALVWLWYQQGIVSADLISCRCILSRRT